MIERTLVVPGFAVICSWSQQEANKVCSMFDLKASKQLGIIKLTDIKVMQKAALNSNGTYLATEEMHSPNPKTFDRLITLWSCPAGQPAFTRWMPYPSVSVSDPHSAEYRLAWMGFTDANKLLTVTEGGRVSLWSMPDRTPIYDKRPLTPKPNKQPVLDIYSWEPKNLALRPDRQMLAIQQEDGVLLINSATGEPSGTLPAVEGIGKETQHMRGMAFSPDGNSLACFMQGVVGAKALSVEYVLVVWDVPNKKLQGIYKLPQSPVMTALTWWGNNNLYGISGGGIDGLIMSAATGKPIRQCLAPSGGRLANGQLDGQLWFSTALIRKEGVSLLEFPPPGEFLSRDPESNVGGFYKRIYLNDNGVEKQGTSTIAKVPFTS